MARAAQEAARVLLVAAGVDSPGICQGTWGRTFHDDFQVQPGDIVATEHWASSVLESLGFDPLPYYRGEPPRDPEFPLMAFTGVREDEFFQTGHRHIASLRLRRPEPEIFQVPSAGDDVR